MQTPWLANAAKTQYPRLKHDSETDVCVIGGGITGMTTAFLLQEQGRRVILLERHSLAKGVSGHTSGHMTSLVDTYYHQLISKYSVDVAREIYEATVEARKTVERLISQNALSAAYEHTPAYYYATDDKQADMLQKERKALEQIGVEVEDADASVMPFVVKDIFKVDDQAVINAAEYIRSLAEVFVENGGVIYEGTPVLDFHHDDDQIVVETEIHSVKARQVVQATHTPLGLNPLQLELKNYNSYVIAGPSRYKVQEGLFYDFADPYNYVRHFEEDGNPMYVVGGFDNKVGTEQDEQQRQLGLMKYTSSHFGLEHVEYAWSSMFFSPSDGVPFIGEDPLHKNMYVATGFSGDGLTYGVISAIVNTALIAQNDHAWKDIFKPARFNLSSSADLMKKGVETFQHLIMDRVNLDGSELEEIKLGGGKIITIGDRKLGVSVKDDQSVHMINPICTHMKCVVHWNSASNTWDCGCHGSRFDADGQVVSGPATKGLEKVDIPVKNFRKDM